MKFQKLSVNRDFALYMIFLKFDSDSDSQNFQLHGGGSRSKGTIQSTQTTFKEGVR